MVIALITGAAIAAPGACRCRRRRERTVRGFPRFSQRYPAIARTGQSRHNSADDAISAHTIRVSGMCWCRLNSVSGEGNDRMLFRRIAAVAAAVALMTGSGTAAAVAQPVTGRAPAQSCSSVAGYLVNGNFNLGVHLAPHNSVDSVVYYPSSGVTHMGFLCVGVDSQGGGIYVIGGGGLCLDEGSASQQNLVYSEGCNDSLTTERWIVNGLGQLENNHYGNCLSSGNANGVTLGGRSCSPSNLNEWFVFAND